MKKKVRNNNDNNNNNKTESKIQTTTTTTTTQNYHYCLKFQFHQSNGINQAATVVHSISRAFNESHFSQDLARYIIDIKSNGPLIH